MKSEESPIFKVMITLSFLMLLFVSFMQGPAQELVDLLQKDFDKEAKNKICQLIDERVRLIKPKVIAMNVQGCTNGFLGAYASLLTSNTDQEARDKFIMSMQEDEEIMDKIEDSCRNSLDEGVINRIAFSLVYNTNEYFGCY